MRIETEFRYIGFDLEAMLAVGKRFASPKVMRFKRAVFDIPSRKGWLRLRTDGIETTLTAKVNSTEKTSESYESEVLVGSFDDALALLKLLGYTPRSVQNNFRILFQINGCDVTVDLWPKIAPIMEIEGENEGLIEKAEAHFGELQKFRTHKTVSELYQDQGIDVKYVPNLDFDIPPSILEKMQL